ncbi:hypothetical protein Ddc_21560 [Ditylenchus destructor]|nr:hypothetical protein Ddc_21560 [Ditylenchus destructor]
MCPWSRCTTRNNGVPPTARPTTSRPRAPRKKGLHYDWFTALELPFSEQRFATPAYLARFGFLVDPSNSPRRKTPATCPGVSPGTKTPAATSSTWISPAPPATPANCIKKTKPCGSTAVPPSTCCPPACRPCAAAVSARPWSRAWRPPIQPMEVRTLCPPGAERSLRRRAQQLRQDFKQSLNKFLKVAWNDTHRGLYPTEEGPGRTDAFGRIANASFGDAISPDTIASPMRRWLPAVVGYLDLRLGAMERLGPTAHGTQHRRSAGCRRDPDLFRRRRPTAPGRCALPFQRKGARPQPDRRNPATPQGPDLARESVRTIDKPLAAQGRALFAENCAGCHVPSVTQENAVLCNS